MSFIRLEDAEYRALFSLIPLRVCFVYYINRVSSIFLNISNITINYIFYMTTAVISVLQTGWYCFHPGAFDFSIITYALVFLQCPLQEQVYLF